MTIYSVSNVTQLTAALAAAAGGDRIELAGGNYGFMTPKNQFSSDVTIVSANPANPAFFTGINIKTASHLIFDGILFDYTYASGDPSTLRKFDINSSSFITIRNSIFSGDTASGGSGTGFGLSVWFSDNIVIEHNECLVWGRAIGVHESNNVAIRGNNIHSFSGDAIQMSGVVGMMIEDNWIHAAASPLSHDDMIQLFNPAGGTRSENITIRGNFLDVGTGESVQLIFMGNESIGLGFDARAYRDILIEDNVIYGAFVHGISVGEADGLVVQNNTLLHDGHATSGPNWIPQININSVSRNVVNAKNIIFGAPRTTTASCL
jgi:hypothetical protein